MYLTAQHLLWLRCVYSYIEMKRTAVWCHSKLINSKPTHPPLEFCVCVCALVSRARYCYGCFRSCCYCLRLFALKIAQLLMQYKPTKRCNTVSSIIYLCVESEWRGAWQTKWQINIERYTIAFNAVKELKKMMIREKNVAQIGMYCANVPIYCIRCGCGCVCGIVLIIAFHAMIFSLPNPNGKPFSLCHSPYWISIRKQKRKDNTTIKFYEMQLSVRSVPHWRFTWCVFVHFMWYAVGLLFHQIGSRRLSFERLVSIASL